MLVVTSALRGAVIASLRRVYAIIAITSRAMTVTTVVVVPVGASAISSATVSAAAARASVATAVRHVVASGRDCRRFVVEGERNLEKSPMWCVSDVRSESLMC